MKRYLVLPVVVFAMIGAACAERTPEVVSDRGGGPQALAASLERVGPDLEALASGVDRAFAVYMNEFSFEPSSFEVEAGERVRFLIVNEGLQEHEFRLTDSHAAAEHVEGGHEGHHEDGAESESGDLLHIVAPGEAKRIVMTFSEKSTFDLLTCLIPGHFEAGMEAGFTVHGAMAADHHDDSEADHHDDSEADHHDDSEADHHDDSEADLGDVDREISITLTDVGYEPADLEVALGERVRFVLTNEEDAEHEFRLTTAHVVEEQRSGGGGHGHDEVVVLLQPGTTETVDVTFDDHVDFEVFACLLPGHEETGQLVITP